MWSDRRIRGLSWFCVDDDHPRGIYDRDEYSKHNWFF